MGRKLIHDTMRTHQTNDGMTQHDRRAECREHVLKTLVGIAAAALIILAGPILSAVGLLKG